MTTSHLSTSKMQNRIWPCFDTLHVEAVEYKLDKRSRFKQRYLKGCSHAASVVRHVMQLLRDTQASHRRLNQLIGLFMGGLQLLALMAHIKFK